jgi:L-asparaginase II
MTMVATVIRSGFVEGRHHGSALVLMPDGRVGALVGEPATPIFPRSVSKPMQAATLVRLISSHLPIADADIAIMSASHAGERFHVGAVRRILRLAGLREDDLGCPPDWPQNPTALRARIRSGLEPSRIQHNCSGKHAGMLLACALNGWPVAGYLDPTHPLQERIARHIEELTREAPAAVGVDGCGAPLFAVSLAGVARAMQAIMTAPAGTPERRVADAMRRHPELVAGTGRPATRLMQAVPGLLAKDGAEGVGVIVASSGLSVAAKVDDGAERAVFPLLLDGLMRVGAIRHLAELDDIAAPAVHGGGDVVGQVTACPQWVRPTDLEVSAMSTTRIG